MITCRSIRIGSLKTSPSKNKDVKFTKKGFRFCIDLDSPRKKTIELVIPAENIKRIEGYLGTGCPLLWVATDAACAARLRKQCGMVKDVYPTPYYDPKSEEIAESRVCLVPLHDPISDEQQLEFRSVLSVIATKRRSTLSSLFNEMNKDVCHDQLVRCTRYISEISALQSTWKLKREKLPDDHASLAIFQDNNDAESIVISSDNESDDMPDSGVPSKNSEDRTSGTKRINKAQTTRLVIQNIKSETNHERPHLAAEKRPADSDSESIHPLKAAKLAQNTTDGRSSTMHKNNKHRRPKENELPQNSSSRSDATFVRPCASLNADMMTSHDDLRSMVNVSPLCICVMKSQYAINFTHYKIVCMAVDNVDGKLTGCLNSVSESFMMRASKNLPSIALCSNHKSRMLDHECCPCCGTFCSGGTFLVCNATKEHQHRFHQHCLSLAQHSRDCPHCGASMSEIHKVSLEPTLEYMKKFETQEMVGVVERSPDKRRESQYHNRVEMIPGITMPLPESFNLNLSSPVRLKKDTVESLFQFLDDDILKKGRGQSKSLFSFVKQGDIIKTLQLLCFGGGHPNSRHAGGKDSRTCLHEAVIRENLLLIHLLVTAGADVNLADESGKTPIFYAEDQNNLDILRYLVYCGSDLMHADLEGMLPLHHSAKEGRLKTCLQLLKYSKNAINSVDEGGWTPLVWSAEHGRADIARCLSHFGASMRSIDEEGNICLQWAALAGNTDVLLLCLGRNSDIDHQNTLGDTALHIAARQDNRQCVVILLAWGANPQIRNREDKTPSDCARESSLAQVSLLTNMMTRCAVADHRGFEPFDRERLLCKDISRGKEIIAISCVNAVDEAPCPISPPHEFLYISKNIHKNTSVNAVKNIMRSCQCEKVCMSCECAPCWYDLSGRLLPSFDYDSPPSITECNPFCKCPKSCINRVIQRCGVRFRIQLFRTRTIGWGVRALEKIPKGSFVCEYVGEVLSNSDWREDDAYLFSLSDKPDGLHHIDGRSYGNVSRFLNHHCEPNLVPVRFFNDHQDVNFPRIAFFTQKAVVPGEQLCFDYGPGFWSVKSDSLFCQCESDFCKYSEKAKKSVDATCNVSAT